MKFVVAYDEPTGLPLDFWPYDWLAENAKAWAEETEGDEQYEEAVYLEQDVPMNLAPAEINGKSMACLGLQFSKGWPVYAVYGDVLKEQYFICNDEMQVLGRTNDLAKAVVKIKELMKHAS